MSASNVLRRGLCAVAIMPKGVYTTVLGYRKDAFPGGKGPQNWVDFWDAKKFPGPRTLRDSPVDNLEFALMADGVAPDKLYPLDIDRAFKKLDAIKPHISVWWKTGAQSAQLLVDKEAIMPNASRAIRSYRSSSAA